MWKKSLARLIRIVTGTFGAAKDEVFSLDHNLTRFEKFVHFWVLACRSYVRNRCPVRAAALAYTTLLALIPMLAVAMSVSSIFLKEKGEDQIGNFIEQFITYVVPDDLGSNAMDIDIEWELGEPVEIPPQPVPNVVMPDETVDTNAPAIDPASLATDARVVAVKQRAAAQIRHFIQNTYTGTLGTIGVIFLLSTAILMLVRIEDTFNDIWGVTQGRTWLARVGIYWTAMSLGPLLLVGALGLASGPRFEQTREIIRAVPFLEPMISLVLPVVLISVTFALFYKLMPNTKVHFRAAFMGGALAGTAWYLFNQFNLYLGSRAVTASKIYGSLFLLPLLMVALYGVWVIVLFGAQVAYAY